MPGYPQGGYQVPGYGAPSGQNNALGIVALVLGILSIPLACCGFFGLLLPVGAIVCGILGMKKADQGLATNKGMALAGLICGGVGAIIAVIIIILSLVSAFNPTNFNSY
jgi:hypothetical protein